MAHYIDKDRLVAEIERLISNGEVKLQESQESKDDESYVAWAEHIATCIKVLSIIDTLKVKKVDLKKEIDREIETRWRGEYLFETKFRESAKHFFELGLKAQKIQDEIKIGETEIYLEDDGGEPPYDGIQWLDLSCMEYKIPKDKFKDGDNVEIIIRKK